MKAEIKNILRKKTLESFLGSYDERAALRIAALYNLSPNQIHQLDIRDSHLYFYDGTNVYDWFCWCRQCKRAAEKYHVIWPTSCRSLTKKKRIKSNESPFLQVYSAHDFVRKEWRQYGLLCL